jgi:hypothetical protein
MHAPINVKSPNNISKRQMGFNSAFKGLKVITEFLSLAICLFDMTECLVKKPSALTKQATVNLFQTKSCNASLRILLCLFVTI